MASEPVKLPSDPPPVILNQDPATSPVVETLATPPVVETPPDEFAAMFANFSKDEPNPVTPATATEPAKIEAPLPKAGDPPPALVSPPVVDPAKAAADAAALEAAKPPVPPAPEPKVDPIERLADLITQRQPPVQEQRQQAQIAPVFTQEEVTALQAFYKDWPEIAQAQELALRANAQQITNHVFTEVARVLGPKLKLLDALADNAQYDSIEKRVPDYTTVQDKVAAWVNTQPAYLKNAFTGVMQSGTADEITDLISRFKTETGYAAPAVQNPPPVVAPPALSPAAKQAAARLAPVNGKRTGVAQTEPSTFEDGFDHFAKLLAT